MQLLIVFCVWALIFVQFQLYGCFGCLEEERLALLHLKAAFNHPNGSSLPAWEGKGDCCTWERVKCHKTTRRVIQLSLTHTREYVMGVWYLNATLFLPLEELRRLDLSWNRLNGWLEHEDLGTLKNLEELVLSFNNFDRSILPSLGNMTSLKALYLQANGLEGPTPMKELGTLKNLEVLDLSSNKLIGSIPASVGALASLKTLYLHTNGLNGSQPFHGLCKLKNLQDLDLRKNKFEGSIPSCLSNLTSIRVLELSYNRFSGKIPSFIITSLTSLEFLCLHHNRFEGLFSFSSFSNHSKLEVVDLGINRLKINTELPPWVPIFHLKSLILSNCTLNYPTATIPNFLSNQYDLRQLDLSFSNMKGQFPTWLLQNNTRLQYLNVSSNFLTGPFHLPLLPNNHMFSLDVSNNRLTGQLPKNIGIIFPNLKLLNMSSNGFEGIIPSSLGEMRQLFFLDLSNNQLSGEMPKQLAMGLISLTILVLSNNKLHGHILPMDSNLKSLAFLYLDGNNFTGKIPYGLFNSSNLSTLDISNNSISGGLPSWIGDLSYLTTLIMARNIFEGLIPTEFCKLKDLHTLDLSWNKLSGSIPSCFNLSSLRYLHLKRNKLRGLITSGFSKSSSLVTLDIRDNDFSSRIPEWIGELSNLRILLLKGNHFDGLIPIKLCQLNLFIVDLSHNNLSGSIPTCFYNISFGKVDTVGGGSFEVYGSWVGYKSERLLQSQRHHNYTSKIVASNKQEEVQFIMKSRSNSYKGNILTIMSGVDLSCNQLTGEIPAELGNMSDVKALNLSHNRLVGLIPETFSNLKQIESLDLSHNRISGIIPSQLIELTFMSSFSVAHNNLSGPIPAQTAQFGTFEESSYEGNVGLCGPPVKKSCNSKVPPSVIPKSSAGDGEEDADALIIFYASFGASYVTFFLGIIAILYFNHNWRLMCFRCMDTFFGSLHSLLSHALAKFC